MFLLQMLLLQTTSHQKDKWTLQTMLCKQPLTQMPLLTLHKLLLTLLHDKLFKTM